MTSGRTDSFSRSLPLARHGKRICNTRVGDKIHSSFDGTSKAQQVPLKSESPTRVEELQASAGNSSCKSNIAIAWFAHDYNLFVLLGDSLQPGMFTCQLATLDQIDISLRRA